MRPSTSGVYEIDQSWRSVLGDAVTLPRCFRDQGYVVKGGGKVFHTGFNDPNAWDKYVPEFKNPVPANAPLNGIHADRPFDWGPLDVDDSEMGDHKIVTTLCPGGKERMRRLMELVRHGRLDLTPLLTHTFPLERITEAYQLFGALPAGEGQPWRRHVGEGNDVARKRVGHEQRP